MNMVEHLTAQTSGSFPQEFSEPDTDLKEPVVHRYDSKRLTKLP